MTFQNIFQIIINWLLTNGLKIFFILFVAYFINLFARKFIKKAVKKTVNCEDAAAGARREKTLIGIFNGILTVAVWLIAGLMIISELGLNIGPILAGAGILGVALGFGAQWMIRDFLAGLFIVVENQYRVGDVVCLDEVCGIVENITLRKTVLRDLDGKVHHFPNGSFTKVANMTYDYSRAHMNVSVAYKEDLDKVIALINKVGKKMAEESPWKENIIKPIQVLGTGPDSFDDSGISIKLLGDTKPLQQWDILREFRRRLKIAFDKENIEIPFPQMSIWPRDKWKK